MLNSKDYIKILFFILSMIFTSTVAYSVYFTKNYPAPILDNISFDAKIQFIREHVDIKKIDTIVVGSSLALNNVQGVFLEKVSKRCSGVLNLSVWSISTLQVEQLLELTDVFPNLERIIYTGQFTSFNHANIFKKFDSSFIKKYISHELSAIKYSAFILNTCKNISFCIQRQKEWKKKHGQNNAFGYLGFDHTGSAPLHIYGKDIIQKRWAQIDGATQNQTAYTALHRIAKKANENNIKFYFIQQPYRQALIKKHKHIQNIMTTFPKKITKILNTHNGKFINLHEILKLDDSYFADRSHLNNKGSKVAAEEIGKLIDMSESK